MAGVDIMLDRDFKFDSDKLSASLSVATYLVSRALSGVKVRPKQYNIRLKPIHSALKWDALGLTSLKSLHKFFPLPKSGSPTKHLVDDAASVTRMSVKGVSGFNYIFRAAKTTFLGNAIGASASWLVKVGLHIFGFFVPEKSDPVKDKWERVWILGKKILCTTVTCIISFIFACICAAIVALIFGSIGTWIGAFTLPCVLAWIAAKLFCSAMGDQIGFGVGNFAGNAFVSLCLVKLGL